MDFRRGDRAYLVVYRGTLGGEVELRGAFIDELMIIDEDSARSRRTRARVIIHGVTLFRTRQEAQQVVDDYRRRHPPIQMEKGKGPQNSA
jgi:hypothetical protein